MPINAKTLPIKIFGVAAFFFGSLLCIVTPPFQVMDEPVHYYRAYQVSMGTMLAIRHGDQVGGVLPQSLSCWVEAAESDLYGGRIFGATNYAYRTLNKYRSLPLEPNHTHFINFNSSAFYPPIIYMPQSAGMAIARIMGGGPLLLLYAGRLANLIVFILVVAWAIQQAPFHRWAFCLLGAMPMNLYHAASLNPDALTFSLHLLFWAFILKIGWGPTNEKKNAVLFSLGAAFILGASKGYWFLLIPAFFISYPDIAPIRKWAWISGMFSLYLAAACFWGYLTRNLIQFNNPEVSPLQQIHHILSNPGAFGTTLLWSWKIEYAIHYVRSMFGMLAWIHIHLPYWLLVCYLSLLFYLFLTDGPVNCTISIPLRMISLCAGFAGIFCIFFWLYCSYNPVGSHELRGVQGRYFIPLIPVVMLALTRSPTRKPIPEKLGLVLIVSGIMTAGMTTLIALFQRFYISS
jgi:uncharacterized membrane protein